MNRNELTKTLSTFVHFVQKYFSVVRVNPYATGTVYVQFQANVGSNEMPLSMQLIAINVQIIKSFNFAVIYLKKTANIFAIKELKALI